MSKFIKIMSLLLISATMFVFSPFAENVMAQSVAANATIVINNKPYVPKNTIISVDNRLLLPFREISEAIGATVDWDNDTRRILTTYGNSYSLMYIDNPTVTFGTYTVDSTNTMRWNSDAQALALDVAPRIINNLTYIPLRTFAETLGADVLWTQQTRTAHINIDPPIPPSATLPADDPSTSGNNPPSTSTTQDKPANYGEIFNDTYFRIMSSEAVMNMYQDSKSRPFAFVLYDSSLDSSKRIVPGLMTSAQKLTYRIFGVDMNDQSNKDSDNDWLRAFFNASSTVDPTLYFVHSKSKVEQMQSLTDLKAVENALVKFQAQVETGFDYGDFNDTTYFKSKSDSFIQQQIDDGKEFIIALYDKTEDNSKYYMPFIKSAAENRKVEVYGLDINRYPKFYNNITCLKDYRYEDLPAMILVYYNLNDIRSYPQPPTLDRAKGYIDEFNANKFSTGSSSGYGDVIDSKNIYVNSDIAELKKRFDKGEEFVIFLYDSANADYKTMVEDFVYNASTSNTVKYSDIVLYGVNRNSNRYKNNLYNENFSWLGIDSLLKYSNPIVVYVKNKSTTYSDIFTSKTYNAAFDKVTDLMY